MKTERMRIGIRNGTNLVMIATAALLATALPAIAGDTAPAPKTMSAAVAEQYTAIQASLAKDSLDQVARHAHAIADLTNAATGEDAQQDSLTTARTAAIHSAAARLAKTKNLKDARAAFGDLSDILIHDNSMISAEHLRVAYCPMAKEYWLQTGDEIANPYFGSAMLRCGKFVDHVAEGEK